MIFLFLVSGESQPGNALVPGALAGVALLEAKKPFRKRIIAGFSKGIMTKEATPLPSGVTHTD